MKKLYEDGEITIDMLAQWYCEYNGLEFWKDIPGLEGYYQASNLGRVRSVTHDRVVNVFNKAVVTKKVKGRVLSIKGKNNKGYYVFNITVDGKRKTLMLHRVIANTWLPNPNNLPCVNHKDEDTNNSCVFNLEWCDVSYNNAYGTAVKRAAIKRSKPVIQCTKEGAFVKEWESVTQASEELNISANSICAVCKNKKSYLTAGGFKWNYKSL